MEKEVIKGKIVHKEGKYLLDVEGKMQELPIGLLSDEKFLKEQVGHEVEVFYSIPKPAVVAIKPLNKRIILCNRPAFLAELAATLVTQPSAEMARAAADKLLKDEVITQEVYNKMTKAIG